MSQITALVTMPPYAPYLREVLQHPLVSGIRLNTVMPLADQKETILKRMHYAAQDAGKDFWIDLKCRQLRVTAAAVPPYTEIKLSHEIEVQGPCEAYFSSREEKGTIVHVSRNRLIMQEGPQRVLGPGESVTIKHSSLLVKKYLTENDIEYIEAAHKAEATRFMLSFVEQDADILEFRKYAPDAELIAKIESRKGMEYVDARQDTSPRLMAARGDLFMQVHWPHEIIPALEKIIAHDAKAIAASRILDSLAYQEEPSCAELGDIAYLMRAGYRTFMFGDEICFNRDSLMTGLNILEELAEYYNQKMKGGAS